jgi:hypothetical protein
VVTDGGVVEGDAESWSVCDGQSPVDELLVRGDQFVAPRHLAQAYSSLARLGRVAHS